MELSRQEYPALATLLQPSQAVTVVNDRIKSINKIHQDIADWLQERRRLEEAYCIGLRRLARRAQPDGTALGIFELPWQRIVTATESLAQSHETLAQQVEADVERPLREYHAKNKDMQTMSRVQQDLAVLARSLETAQKKADKLKDKGPKAAGKSSSAASAAQDARSQWESRAPFVFEQLQAIDEHRLNHLRDILTQLQTHEADQVERNRQSTENCLNALLAADTAEEITAFALRASGGRTADMGNRNPPTTASSQPEATPMETLQPPPRINDDAASQCSSHSNHGRSSFATEHQQQQQQQNPQQRHTSLGGLKRLGTVMGRRRSIVQTTSGHASPEKKYRPPFMSFRRTESTRSFHQVDNQPASPNGLTPARSRDGSSHYRPGSSATGHGSQSEPQIETVLNGATIPEEAVAQETPAAHTEPHEERPISPKQQTSTDADGFSVKPESIDEISKIQKEAAANEDPGLNLTIRDQPIREDEGEAKQAMNEVANTLRLQAKQSGLARGPGTLRGRRDVRNTIFIPNPPPPDSETHNELPSKATLDTLYSSMSPSHVPQSATPSVANQDDHTISDVTSIHSSQTLHSLAGPISHPELSAPGLNASIVEKLNVLISGGVVTKSFVVGELALAYNPTEGFSLERQLIRLDNFQVLERVAANPQFVTEVSASPTNGVQSPENTETRKGEYNIALSSLKGPAPTVAFKYQVHLDSSNLSAYCPVIFHPIWNEQEFQASVIINYSLNPQFMSAKPLISITLQNLLLTVSLDLSPVEETKQPREVARASGAAMHPNIGAAFRRKTSSVVWKIPELEIKADGENRFLARFTTTTPWPRRGRVEARFDAIINDTSLRLGISSRQPAIQDDVKPADPFSDTSGDTSENVDHTTATETWTDLPTQRKLSASRYVST